MSPPSTMKEEFNKLPRPYKQLQFCRDQILREATAFKELPSVLIPNNDRRTPLPPLVHYGFPLRIEQLDELLERKLGAAPRVLDGNPFGVLVYLQREVFGYGLQLKTVYLDGTDSMLFISIASNWKPSRSKRLGEVVKQLKDFLEVNENPVWCLDTDNYYWRK